MRLHFTLSPNLQPVGFDYPQFLTRVFHCWSGAEEKKDRLDLYSLGWLQGGNARGGALHFPHGASWFVSAPDTDEGNTLLQRVTKASRQTPAVCYGMQIIGMEVQPTPNFGERRVFRSSSPIFLRGARTSHGLEPHLTWRDEGADALLTEILHLKMAAAELGKHIHGTTVRFDDTFHSPKTRLIEIEGSPKRVNVCPIIAEGSPAALDFLWNVGAGHLTGSAFGSLV